MSGMMRKVKRAIGGTGSSPTKASASKHNLRSRVTSPPTRRSKRRRKSKRAMEEDEEDMYAPDETVDVKPIPPKNPTPPAKDEVMEESSASDDDDDSGEEESDSDIEIVTEGKGAPAPEHSGKSLRIDTVKQAPVRPELPGITPKSTPVPIKNEPPPSAKTPAQPSKPGSSYPAIKWSTVDVDAKPIHEASGKLITEIDMDADFGDDDKAWRRPGTDQTDFFNYGFDEFTWASYCIKQEAIRKENKESKKQLEDINNFMGMPGAMPAAPSGPAAMPGIPDFPPEMQQMMQQMMQSGMDPSQMDFNQFAQMMGQAGPGGIPGQAQFAQQPNQQMAGQNYGYGGGGGHGGGQNRPQGGRGQGQGRRQW